MDYNAAIVELRRLINEADDLNEPVGRFMELAEHRGFAAMGRRARVPLLNGAIEALLSKTLDSNVESLKFERISRFGLVHGGGTLAGKPHSAVMVCYFEGDDKGVVAVVKDAMMGTMDYFRISLRPMGPPGHA